MNNEPGIACDTRMSWQLVVNMYCMEYLKIERLVIALHVINKMLDS